MDLKLFAKDFMTSAQNTIHQELDTPHSGLHQLTTKIHDTLVKALIKVSVGIFMVFFTLAGVIFSLHEWFDVSIWVGCWGAALLSLILFLFIHLKGESHEVPHH